jgi:hypothetical protein
VIPSRLRETIGVAIRDRLHDLGGRVLSISVSGQHLRIQVQLATEDARSELGEAKRHAWFVVREQGWSGKLWAKRPKIIRIRDRAHQERVYYYILDHAKEGAWVWSELNRR